MATVDFKHLRELGNTKYAVFGYIRYIQREFFPKNDSNPYYTIPELIIFLCLSYYHAADYFDEAHCASNIELSNNNKTITRVASQESIHYDFTRWSKSHCLNWINATDDKIIKWK